MNEAPTGILKPLRRRLSPQERRGDILDLAAQTILNDGQSAFSMGALARLAGVSKDT